MATKYNNGYSRFEAERRDRETKTIAAESIDIDIAGYFFGKAVYIKYESFKK